MNSVADASTRHRAISAAVMAVAVAATALSGARAQDSVDGGADRGSRMRLDLSLAGRATLANAFEAGEPAFVHARLVNTDSRPLTLAAAAGLVTVTVSGAGSRVSFDPYEQRRAHYAARLGRALRPAAPAGGAMQLAPGAAVDLCGLVADWTVASAPLDCRLPAAVMSMPGDYTVDVAARPRQAGRTVSAAVQLRVLGAAEMARLEAGLAVSRAAALDAAHAAAVTHFGTATGVAVSEPVRLRLIDGPRRWDVAYVHDTGLLARWVRVSVDAASGRIALTPFGNGG